MQDINLNCQLERFKLVIFQDIRQCDGPMEALLDLNQEARDKTQEIKGRIEVNIIMFYFTKSLLN